MTQDDIADAAHVSRPYYGRIERGNAVNISDEVIASLAVALRLTLAETDYLRALNSPRPMLAQESPEPLDAGRVAYVRNLEPQIAAIVSGFWDVLACNVSYRAAFPGLDEGGNVLEWLLFDPAARQAMVEWEAETRLTVEWLRGTIGKLGANRRVRDLMRTCLASSEFRTFWEDRGVVAGRTRPGMHLRGRDGVITTISAELWEPTESWKTYRLYLAVPAASDAGPAQ